MEDYITLSIGDTSDDGKIKIVDEDRLCYIVENMSKGARGLRTISKNLLKEFIEYVMLHPDASSSSARVALSGKTDIDKYEYGYNATLFVMAQMSLSPEKIIRKEKVLTLPLLQLPLQQIFYGAPGTGKSHTILEKTEGEGVIRTTFHPDSDYSTFVGAYKPATVENTVMTVIGTKVVPVKDEDGKERKETKIVYEFVEQAFLQAYIAAWKKIAEAGAEKPKKQYLVIEEINRGNCAQIFGDLFQLLDRNDSGFSEYPINADSDMKDHLSKALKGLTIAQKETIDAQYKDGAVTDKVLKGEILLLPNNLFIWATMNTSDQSLFPIDSAFKRRWDWTYMPICEARNDDKSTKKWQISVSTNRYDWWSFLKKINDLIWLETKSEDKKLGYFFCKAQNGIISAETFVGKVIFYLWNDVFKDFEFNNEVFNDEEDVDNPKLTFDKFYQTDVQGRPFVVTQKVMQFLSQLKLEPSNVPDENEGEESDGEYTKSHIKVIFPDGYVEENNNSAKTFINAINRIGPSRVAELNLKVSSYDMLSKVELPDDTGGYRSSQRFIKDGYYLITKLSNSEKVARLQLVSKKLNLNLSVTTTD